MIAHEVRIVRATMVGCEEHKIVSTAYLSIQSIEKAGKIAVKLYVDIVDFGATCAVHVADNIGRRYAHSEHIGLCSQAESFVFQRSFSHIERHGDALRFAFNVRAGFLQMLLVKFNSP